MATKTQLAPTDAELDSIGMDAEPTEQQILEAAFAPAQPAAEPSRFGSPELQAMIIVRCVEKDQATQL